MCGSRYQGDGRQYRVVENGRDEECPGDETRDEERGVVKRPAYRGREGLGSSSWNYYANFRTNRCASFTVNRRASYYHRRAPRSKWSRSTGFSRGSTSHQWSGTSVRSQSRAGTAGTAGVENGPVWVPSSCWVCPLCPSRRHLVVSVTGTPVPGPSSILGPVTPPLLPPEWNGTQWCNCLGKVYYMVLHGNRGTDL